MRAIEPERAGRIAVLALAVAVVLGTGAHYARTIKGLYTELRQQRQLLAAQQRAVAEMEANRKLAETLSSPRVLALEDMAGAMVSLSVRMKEEGLRQTYFKLEQREVTREADGITEINRLVVEGVGAYADALRYLSGLMNGEAYYFLESISLSAEDGGVRLKLAVVIAGHGAPGADVAEPPAEYRYRNPFGGGDARQGNG